MTEAPATRSVRRMTQATWWVFGVALVWLSAHALGLLGPLEQLTYPLLSIGSVIAIVVGVRVNKPDSPGPWYVLTSGMVLFFIGGVARTTMGTEKSPLER